MHPRTFLHILIFLAISGSAFCASPKGLRFETQTVEVTLEAGTAQTEIVFNFENLSDKPVEIDRHQAPCSCIDSKFKDGKKVYQPGEKGDLFVTISLANLYGTVQKQVVVWLKGAPANKPSFVLTAKITIPNLILIEPRSLHWIIDEEPIPKSYKITTHHKDLVRITDVVTTNNQFKTELKTIIEGKEYEITVTPTNTSGANFGIVKITTDCEIPRFRRASAFALVRAF